MSRKLYFHHTTIKAMDQMLYNICKMHNKEMHCEVNNYINLALLQIRSMTLGQG